MSVAAAALLKPTWECPTMSPGVCAKPTEPTVSAWRLWAGLDKHVQFCAANNLTCWDQIDKKTTRDYGRWLAATKSLADRTITLELNLVCSVSKWLVEEDFLPSKCRFLLKLSKPDGTTTYPYTKAAVVRMLEFCRADPDLNWMGHVITGLATTGLRIGELGKLRWSDIDADVSNIRLTDERARPRRRQSGNERRVKGKRGRAIPINPALQKLLIQLPRHRDGLVFRAQRGGSCETDACSPRCKAASSSHWRKSFRRPRERLASSTGPFTASATILYPKPTGTERPTPSSWSGWATATRNCFGSTGTCDRKMAIGKCK